MNVSRKNTLFSSIPPSKDVKNIAEVRVKQQTMNGTGEKIPDKLDMFLDKQEWPHKINAMTYYEALDMLSIGFNDGTIVTYTFEIESFVHSGGDMGRQNASASDSQARKSNKTQSRQLLQSPGNEISRANFV